MEVGRKSKVLVVLFLVIQVVFGALRLFSTRYDYMVWKRVHHLANVEFIFLLCSLLILGRIGDLTKLFHSLLRDVVRSAVLLFVVAAQASFGCHFWLQGTEPHLLAMFAMISNSTFVHVSAFLLGFCIVEYIGGKIMHNLESKVSSSLSSQIKFLICSKKFHTTLSIVLAIVFTAMGLHATSIPPNIVERQIFLRKFPKQLDGFRIVLLTDVHIGPTVGKTRLKDMVTLTNKLNPGTVFIPIQLASAENDYNFRGPLDIVAIAGDLVDGSLAQLEGSVATLGQLKAKYGTVYSTGNHEYYHGNPSEWLEYLEKIGVKPLHNSNIKIYDQTKSTYLCFSGVDDVSSANSGAPGHGMNVTDALKGCEPDKATVLLVHQPNGIKKLLSEGRAGAVDLFLSGHTHGGQYYVVLPFAYLVNSFFLGLYHLSSGAQVYVSAGVNFWGPPVKMYGFNEITVITLLSK